MNFQKYIQRIIILYSVCNSNLPARFRNIALIDVHPNLINNDYFIVVIL